ncbi:MAG: hypothetical protein Kow0013_20060 [Pararhodobacter sp.]
MMHEHAMIATAMTAPPSAEGLVVAALCLLTAVVWCCKVRGTRRRRARGREA